jgi:predicted nucleic acid-binding protein
MAGSFTATSIVILEEVQFLAFKHHPVKEDVFALLKEIENNTELLLPVTVSDYHLAMELFNKDSLSLQSTKDYFHAACMLNANIRFIVSNDSDFDHFQQIKRIDPIKFISQSSHQ